MRPSSDARVWREQGYEICQGGVWETGQFDRVVFTGAGAGRRATIYDFKTNARRAGETDAAFRARLEATYAGQMQAYARALAVLTGMKPEQIVTRILPVEADET